MKTQFDTDNEDNDNEDLAPVTWTITQSAEFYDTAPDPTFAENEDLSVTVANQDRENGYDVAAGPLDWLNSAGITLNPERDEVSLSVSIGDPRGAFVLTVRRTPDGRILIHVPHAGEGMAHMETKQLHPGTLEVL